MGIVVCVVSIAVFRDRGWRKGRNGKKVVISIKSC